MYMSWLTKDVSHINFTQYAVSVAKQSESGVNTWRSESVVNKSRAPYLSLAPRIRDVCYIRN